MTTSESPLATKSNGPLSGMRVVEFAGIGPTPYATMILAELGADVIRIERPNAASGFETPAAADLLNRGKRSVSLDLKDPEELEDALRIVDSADVVIEGYRPGVAERIGIGPDTCLARNGGLVYGRMTGWGQTGPLAERAGHDINYIAVTGALHAIGTAGGPPAIPLNLVGDFGGGSLFLVIGVLAAWRHARETGEGQVVDAAIVDGASHLLAGIHSLLAGGRWTEERGTNPLDGGEGYYGVYRTGDGRYLSVGAIEPQFFAALMTTLGLPADTPQHGNPGLRATLESVFATRTLSEWLDLFDGRDACVAPILGLREAADHPHIAARGSLVIRDGVLQSAPAPRFSKTTTTLAAPAPERGADTAAVRKESLSQEDLHAL